jgi:hypothetical protein
MCAQLTSGAEDPDLVFKREVAATLLRVMQLAEESSLAAQDMANRAIIELNAVKIAGICARWKSGVCVA